MIVEKISQEDLHLYEILRNPVLCTEFVNNIDKLEWEEPFEFHTYQKDLACDFNSHVSTTAARAVGKTVTLVGLIVWILVNNIFPEDYIVYTVPNKVHLEPVFTGLVRAFRSNSFLKHFIEPKKGINSSTFTVKLLNNSTLICRIAGQSGTGANVIGLHTPFVLADELGYYPWGTWQELQPIVNTWTPGYRVIGSGVPTGLREQNVLYHLDMENSNYTKHRISAYDNPRFTEEDEERAIEQYGGKDTDDFIHLVLGRHGSAVFAVFDRRLMEISNYPVYKLVIDGIKIKDNLAEYINRLSVFPSVPENRGVFIGIDLGYTDPTAIIVFYLDRLQRIKIHGRIQLNKVPYPIQTRFIDMLDNKLKPFVFGIDEGHSGLAVTQRLQQDEEYYHKNYRNSIIPINFASQISLGFDHDGNEIKSKTKPFSVSILQDYSNNHKIVYTSTDLELISELERMTYSRNPMSGEISYKTLTPKGGKRGEDHFTAAMLCGMMAYYLTENKFHMSKKPKLLTPRWVAHA